MNYTNQTRLARLRPDKLDDVSVKEQILLIQQACGNVNPEKIALVFHECDYNIQQTINRIRAGELEDGGWQTAKSSNKKKNHSVNDKKTNGGNLSDSERSLSQRTSPTSSLRGMRHQNDQYSYSSSTRINSGRRGNGAGRNNFIPPSGRYAHRNKPGKAAKLIPDQASSVSQQSHEESIQNSSLLLDEYEFADGIPQSLSFDNSQMKTSLQTLSKHRTPSAIPQEPVSMHPTVLLSTEPIDIQFGDVQWNDSVPIAVSPSDNTLVSTTFDNNEEDISNADDQNHGQNEHVQNDSSTNFVTDEMANEIDNPLTEATNQLTSLSINETVTTSNLSGSAPEGTSHLSDHLTETASSMPTQYSTQQPTQIQMSVARLPSATTVHVPEHTVTTSQYMPTNFPNNDGVTASAFTPFNPLVNYSPITREYSQATPMQSANWNAQSINYKNNTKSANIPAAVYPQQPSYQISAQQQQQQQIFLGTIPYPPLSSAVVPVFATIDQWPATYSAPLEPYPYTTANYIPPYLNQQQYHAHPAKYDQHVFDKEFLAHYGQGRPVNNDIQFQQQQQPQSTAASQQTKDSHLTSKLSPNAATFHQGAPLTASPTAPTAVYLNQLGHTIPAYYSSIPGTIHPDQMISYQSIDNRDNRNGASYNSANNRNNYYHHGQHQQQRIHNNNGSNSHWHLQQ